MPNGTKPETEYQARHLAKLPPADQPKAWEKANEIAKAEGKPVAARHVEQAVAEAADGVVVGRGQVCRDLKSEYTPGRGISSGIANPT